MDRTTSCCKVGAFLPTFLCQGTKEGLEKKVWRELVDWVFAVP